MDVILQTTRTGSISTFPLISVIVSTLRPQNLQTIYNNYVIQNYPNKELVLIMHQDAIDHDHVYQVFGGINNCSIYQVSQNYSLGYCLNNAMEVSNGDFITKMDDDDIYLEAYLSSSLQSLYQHHSDMIGKCAHYVYLESINRTIYLNLEKDIQLKELAGLSYLLGATIFFKSSIKNHVSFRDLHEKEDSFFIKDCLAYGYQAYSTDPYQYLRMRFKDKRKHTHKMSDFKKYGHLILKKKLKLVSKGINLSCINKVSEGSL